MNCGLSIGAINVCLTFFTPHAKQNVIVEPRNGQNGTQGGETHPKVAMVLRPRIKEIGGIYGSHYLTTDVSHQFKTQSRVETT